MGIRRLSSGAGPPPPPHLRGEVARVILYLFGTITVSLLNKNPKRYVPPILAGLKNHSKIWGLILLNRIIMCFEEKSCFRVVTNKEMEEIRKLQTTEQNHQGLDPYA